MDALGKVKVDIAKGDDLKDQTPDQPDLIFAQSGDIELVDHPATRTLRATGHKLDIIKPIVPVRCLASRPQSYNQAPS